MPISLAHHLGGITLNQARFHVFLIIFKFFGIKMPWHVLHACAHALSLIVENTFEFTAHGINLHTSTQIYDFSNRYG